ncbi:hypothetical protein [Acuticoccus sp. I52.16.1]|uniref:hypothetical protein n=1 Tax=Acuticoccus sp. I52.16.1 TaxID=2928472 RepID=UPI001FD33E47|nr:hypothetical protein [Acuticoccus sp. I52.16.1]UOM32636.1 hypothetical protein MRB58_12160 [Acuticoccus sp. I52.16.1]
MTTITLEGQDDAALAKTLARALRGAPAITLEGPAPDALTAAASAWAKALDAARVPVTVRLTGPVGPRGLALLLLADAPTADGPAAPAAHPLLAVLAQRRLGPALARRLLAAADPLAVLAAAGHLGADAVAASHRAALLAAAELPFAEAVDYAALLPTGDASGDPR